MRTRFSSGTEGKAVCLLRQLMRTHRSIYGIDWSQTKPTEIVTCLLDKTIKVWDSKTMTLRTRMKTGYPVWRARGLPFGRGVLSLAQRGETALEMFSREPRIRPWYLTSSGR
ncbi:hypothetical protein F5051DRAFT_229217 [Lentinula edodes]|nr:hypothetical protein F5051DRAFT_229217 [Lentinula edodes]